MHTTRHRLTCQRPTWHQPTLFCFTHPGGPQVSFTVGRVDATASDSSNVQYVPTPTWPIQQVLSTLHGERRHCTRLLHCETLHCTFPPALCVPRPRR